MLSVMVMTDQTDYAPGSTALISGNGFQPGDAITLQVTHTDGNPDVSPANDPWTVTADSNGDISSSWYVDPASSTGDSLELAATDPLTGDVATADFTDATSHVNSVSTTASYGASYTVGAKYVINVNFSATETVTGTPEIKLNTTPAEYAMYTGGTGSSTLSFTYTVAAGDNSAQLDYASTSALALNGGTIKNSTTNATLTLPATKSSNDGVYNNYNFIDTTAPTVSGLTVTPSPANVPVTIGANASDNNGVVAAEYFVDTFTAHGSGTPLTVSSPGTTPVTLSGTQAVSGLSNAQHTILVYAEDAAGNWSAQAAQQFTVDNLAPTATLSAPTAANQSPINFTATFNLAVSGINPAKLTVTGGTLGTITGSGTTWTIPVIPSTLPSPQTGEPVTLQILAGAAQNSTAPGEYNTASNTASVLFDNQAPVLNSTNLVAVNPSTLAPGTIISPYASFQIQLVYNEPVIATNAVLHLNAATQTGVTGSGTNTLTFTFGPSSVASTRLDFASTVLAGTITDAAGNAAGLPTANDGLYNDDIVVNGFSSQTSITPLTNIAPFTFQISSSLPIAGLNGTGAGWFNGTYGTISNIQFTPGSNSFTVQVAPPNGQTKVSISAVAGNIYYNALPGAAYWCNSYSNVAAVATGDVLPSVAVTSAPNANFNAPLTLMGTYNANGGAAVTTVQIELTPINSGAYPPTVYTAVLNNGNWSYTVPANTLASGPYSVFAIATNGTEIVSSPQTTLSIVDNQPPVTTASTYTYARFEAVQAMCYTSTPANSFGWFTSYGPPPAAPSSSRRARPTLTRATRVSPPPTTPSTLGRNRPTRHGYVLPALAGHRQRHTVTYWSVDGAGNVETAHVLAINIDTTTPTVTVNPVPSGIVGDPLTITGTWTESVSGVSQINVSVYDYVTNNPYITVATLDEPVDRHQFQRDLELHVHSDNGLLGEQYPVVHGG